MTFKENLIRNIGNIPGWSTREKIIVIESDDWGSIRMSSRKNRDNLIGSGFDFTDQSFNQYDALESNNDMTALFDILQKHKDSTGRPPVFTAASIIANPDFEKIKAANYKHYHYEPFTETLRKYPEHDQVFDLYKQGISNRLFYPVFHGREHLNVQRWMRALQSGNKAVLTAFGHDVTCIHLGPDKEFLGDFQAAFDLDSPDDLSYQHTVIRDGLALFEQIHGYRAAYFVPPNGPFNNTLSETLAEEKINFMLGERIQKEPLGNQQYKKHFHYIGMTNHCGQVYITRNAAFEPSISGNEQHTDPIGNCLKQIAIAFRWGKPAVISSHRVNYIGFIEEKNRKRNLKLLDSLLLEIMKRWPEVEFMTSVELGNCIKNR